MKKYFALTACLLAAVLLTSCGAAVARIADVSAVPSLSSVGEPAGAEAVCYSAELRVFEDTAAAEDGTALISRRYALPELHACRPDGSEITEPENGDEERALQTVETFSAEFQEWAAEQGGTGSDLVAAAGEDYAAAVEAGIPWQEYADELSCSLWQTDHMISVSAVYYTYTGGAHPNTVLLAWNFDLDAGAFVEPAVLAEDRQEFQDAVTEEIVRQANVPLEDGTVPAAGYWENYREIAAQWQNYAVSFGEDGMTVGFSPYELACYAAGRQVFTVGWDTLLPLLSPYGKALLGMPQD